MAHAIDAQYEADTIASAIADKWVVWNGNKAKWLEEKKELRAYLFATSTRDTTNNKLPWKNSTATPKLTQIRDNLHANYMAALFPRENWFIWKGAENDAMSKSKREKIEAYMRTKLAASDFTQVVSQLVLDYIDYGNVFPSHEYVRETKIDPVANQEQLVYAGPKAYRISPLDIVFDVTAPCFDKSPCIVRRIRSIGELREDAAKRPWLKYDPAILEKCHALRTAGADTTDALKNAGLAVDGFGSLQQYLQSGMVELLDFYGTIYDPTTGTSHTNIIATVVDRRWMLRCMPNPSWNGERPIKHCGWRLRPDNLWAQGPLDQLVGMQYRIDHLENLKADIFDQIAHPVIKIKGREVDDFVFGPGQKIYVGDDGDVEFMRPDSTALSANVEIQEYMDRMEELAGAPRQAMGIRTPGEKTKYEVQVLENGAGRIFQSKVVWFEKNVLEPLLNSMFEEAVRNMGTKDSVLMKDPDYGTEKFVDITRDDVIARGKFYPVGARHFAEQAIFTQELTQTLQLAQSIPSITPHISGKNVAKALEEVMGWKTFQIVKDNVAIVEQMETQRLVQAAQEQVGTEAGMPSELQDGDLDAMAMSQGQPPVENVPRNI